MFPFGWIKRLKRGDPFGAIRADDWNKIANVLETIEGEGGIAIVKTENGLHWRIGLEDDDNDGGKNTKAWILEIGIDGEGDKALVVRDAVLLYGGELIIVGIMTCKFQSENSDHTFFCDFNYLAAYNNNPVFTMGRTAPIDTSSVEADDPIRLAVENGGTHRIYLCTVVDGKITHDFIHGVYAPFLYDLRNWESVSEQSEESEEVEE